MIYSGSCHCGAIAFEVEAEITQAMDCNCSMCRRRGGLLAFVPRENLTLKTPASAVSTYQFNKHVIQHHSVSTVELRPMPTAKARPVRWRRSMSAACRMSISKPRRSPRSTGDVFDAGKNLENTGGLVIRTQRFR
jgi:hypothetical protein